MAFSTCHPNYRTALPSHPLGGPQLAHAHSLVPPIYLVSSPPTRSYLGQHLFSLFHRQLKKKNLKLLDSHKHSEVLIDYGIVYVFDSTAEITGTQTLAMQIMY